MVEKSKTNLTDEVGKLIPSLRSHKARQDLLHKEEIYDKSKKVMKSILHTLQDIMIGENAIGTLITTTSEEKQNDPEQHSHRESQQGETT